MSSGGRLSQTAGMRKLFLVACLLAAVRARPPRSRASRHYGDDHHDNHDRDDHDHHYHRHDHYYHHDDHRDDDHDDRHAERYPDPHDSPDHETVHFLKVHNGQGGHGGPYIGHGYHNSDEHYVKVYHQDEVDSYDDHDDHHDDIDNHDDDHDDHDDDHDDHDDDQDDHDYQDDDGGYGWGWGWGWNEDDEDCDCEASEANSRLLDDLTHQVSTVNDMLDTFLTPQAIFEKFEGLADDLNKMDSRAACAPGQYQCGGDEPHCVSAMMVCDGQDDCHNASDEDEYHCHVVAAEGSHWTGSVVYDHCTQRQPKTIDLIIKDVHTPSWFTVQPQVTAQASIEIHKPSYDQYVNLELHGHWASASRTLYFGPPDDDGLALTCQFHGHDADTCIGHIERQVNGEQCAEFVFHKN